jgi:hypothetical protein
VSPTIDNRTGSFAIVGSTPGRVVGLLGLIVALACAAQIGCGWIGRGSSTIPARLSDAEFWDLSTRLSETPGTFDHSDNLVSNEVRYVHLARVLRSTGGVYIGVGPEQNFSYIARLEPAMAFIIDIRQRNRNLHLLYKALFELSTDRAEFLSNLFSRQRPSSDQSQATVQELFEHFDRTKPDARLYQANFQVIRDHLLTTHGFALPAPDLEWIDYAFTAFYMGGPDLHYGRLGASESPGPSYRALMTAADVSGHNRSFLATEESFAVVKDLHLRNMIVPIVGDFAGPQAIRGAGEYIHQHNEVVKAFYASNVEVYLNRPQTGAFCGNLTTLPYDSGTWFIGSKAMQPFATKLKSCPVLPR